MTVPMTPPRTAWTVKAVLRKSGSSPRLLWMIMGASATSENITSAVVRAHTIDASPNAAG